MTIPTPTSNPVHTPGGAGGVAPPAGLPDVATLTQLASQFFAALPGTAGQGGALPSNPVPGDPSPAGFAPGPLTKGPALPGTFAPGANIVPTTPQELAGGLASGPALAPKSAAMNGLPDHAAIVPPALNGRFGGHALGVPQVAPRAAPGSAAPFYFLSDGA